MHILGVLAVVIEVGSLKDFDRAIYKGRFESGFEMFIGILFRRV